MTEHPIVPLELQKGRIRSMNRFGKNRFLLNLKSNGVELSFYSYRSKANLVRASDCKI